MIPIITLTLLGIIIEKPISAYHLKKEIQYRNLNEWTKISYPTIFKKVIQLEKQGYLESYSEKNGNYPSKQVYQITVSGREYFQKLMREASVKEVKIPIDINAIIANIEKVSKEQSITYLHNVLKQIDNKKEKLERVSLARDHIPISGKAIIQQQLDFYTYLSKWVQELITYYTEQGEENNGKN